MICNFHWPLVYSLPFIIKSCFLNRVNKAIQTRTPLYHTCYCQGPSAQHKPTQLKTVLTTLWRSNPALHICFDAVPDVYVCSDSRKSCSPNDLSLEQTVAHTFVCFVLHCCSQDRDCSSSLQSAPCYTYHGQPLSNKETKHAAMATWADITVLVGSFWKV